MTRVLPVINVVLDVMANREPFAADAEVLLRTKDKKGFKKYPVKSVTPEAALALIS